ncbi:MAG: DNA polymerase III subunit chi [Pseudomonadota bacterium]|nr:DNA polymerase III subunit chi [Pseudomonadota bacterium]
MARVDFYHLQKRTLDETLPILLQKAYGTGKRIKIKIGTEERVEFINSLLWTYNDESFLPHGSKKDGFAEQQPVWLSSDSENPNDAVFLFLVDGAAETVANVQAYERIFNIFDGNSDEALQLARQLWKEYKNAGFEVYYWQQDNNGKWQQKV